jgi:hypothetical protein
VLGIVVDAEVEHVQLLPSAGTRLPRGCQEAPGASAGR